MTNNRVAVIGAGPSGLAQLHAFQVAAKSGKKIPEIVCFEKQRNWGGLWNYDWRTGVDENGEPCHNSMYRYLWSNGPKEGLEFADYSFEEHFGKQIASFPPREVLFEYIEGRALNSGIRKWIRFNSSVRWVQYDPAKELFSIIVNDFANDSSYFEEFKHVVVASGHFSTPNVPHYQGFEKFNGRILHAHDFRDAREFTDKRILILGSSYSAEDIGSQCWKYGCKSITISHRTAPTGIDWPNNWKEVPSLIQVEGNRAHFTDGSFEDLDAIILCTGYKHHFPFLHDDLRLKTINRLAVNNLYKGIAWINNPKFFYLGMQDQWFTFNMFDAQAWWARDVIMGKIKLPLSKADMLADVDERIRREEVSAEGKYCIRYQGNYVQELIKETDYPNFNVDEACKAFYKWKQHKSESIMHYRDNSHASVITGMISPIHHTPWIDTMDDSMEVYLQN